jgi:mannose-1-phosphate guanylyltransferase
MNTHHLAEQVTDYVSRLQRNLKIYLVREVKLLGSAGTVRENADFVDGEDAFLVIYADNLSNVDLSRMTAFHESHSSPITMGLFRTSYPTQCGIAVLDRSNRVIEFAEKPEHPRSDLANAGLYTCDVSTIPDIPGDKPAVDYAYDVLPMYVGRMHGLPLDCFHLDIGNHESYAQAQATCPFNMPS